MKIRTIEHNAVLNNFMRIFNASRKAQTDMWIKAITTINLIYLNADFQLNT